MAHRFSFLTSPDAAQRRDRRGIDAIRDGYMERRECVALVRIGNDDYVELDAETDTHAMTLALDWLKRGVTKQVLVFGVMPGGALFDPVVYTPADLEAVTA